MNREIDDTSENVLSQWPREQDAPAEDPPADEAEATAQAWGVGASGPAAAAPYDGAAEPKPEPEPDLDADPRIEEHSVEAVAAPQPSVEEELEEAEDAAVEDDEPEYGGDDGAGIALAPSLEHAAGELEIPEGYAVLEGVSDGGRRAVGVVVSRFNGSVTSRLLERALSELDLAGVRREAITIMVVPGAFELPLAATALAKTRHFACIVALGCVIRGDTPHFEYVASEAASGLQLAALETGVPVSFGVLTLERVEQAEPRIEKAAEAVRSALEMADVFSHLRAAAAR